MDYWVKRGDSNFGPYTEADLRAYLVSGNVVEKDLVRSADSGDWQPLKKRLREWDKTAPLITGLRADLPSPPDMPWWMAMLLEIFSVFTFFIAWDVVEGVWMRRVQRQSRALLYFSIAAILFIVNAPALYSTFLHNVISSPVIASSNAEWLGIASFTMRIVARFSMRHSLLEHFNQTEPIGLKLSWWMTLLFGGLYFQYHFNRINDAKRLMQAATA